MFIAVFVITCDPNSDLNSTKERLNILRGVCVCELEMLAVVRQSWWGGVVEVMEGSGGGGG